MTALGKYGENMALELLSGEGLKAPCLTCKGIFPSIIVNVLVQYPRYGKNIGEYATALIGD
jgi:hypothetical protein